jgi:hypothetical protein
LGCHAEPHGGERSTYIHTMVAYRSFFSLKDGTRQASLEDLASLSYVSHSWVLKSVVAYILGLTFAISTFPSYWFLTRSSHKFETTKSHTESFPQMGA